MNLRDIILETGEPHMSFKTQINPHHLQQWTFHDRSLQLRVFLWDWFILSLSQQISVKHLYSSGILLVHVESKKRKSKQCLSSGMLLISIWEVDSVSQLYSFVVIVTSPVWNYLHKNKFYWGLHKARGGDSIKLFEKLGELWRSQSIFTIVEKFFPKVLRVRE